jgi:hypothetical protein
VGGRRSVRSGLCNGCRDHPGETDGLIYVPGSTVKIAQIDNHHYSVAFDGMQFSEPTRDVVTGSCCAARRSIPPVDKAPTMTGVDGRPTELYLVQFITPPLEAMRAHLTQLGAHPHGYVPSNALLVRMSPGVAVNRREPTLRRWVGPYQPSYRIEPARSQRLRCSSARRASTCVRSTPRPRPRSPSTSAPSAVVIHPGSATGRS